MNVGKFANYRPIVLASICLALGIFIGALTANVGFAFFVILSVFIVATVVSFFLKFTSIKIGTIFLLIGFLAMSITCFTAFTEEVRQESFYFEGRVKEITDIGESKNRYVLEDVTALGENVGGKVLVDLEEDYKIGDVIGVEGSFENIPFNPFDSYSVSKHRKNIIFKSNGENSVKLRETKQTLIEKIRIKLASIYLEELGDENGGIALGLVLGETSYVDYETAEEMRESGLSHLFSVSGLHVGFMSTIIFVLFKLFRVDKKKSIIWVILILLFYGALTGFPVGVVRASIMSILILFAEIRLKRYDQLNGLALTVIIILLVNPLELFSVSFLLSVAAMFGIACFYWSITNLYKGDNYFIKSLVGSMAVSISANVFVLPVSAYYFGTASLYFVLANLLVVPLASLSYFLLVPLSVFSLIIPELGILMVPIRGPLFLIRFFTSMVSALPFATLKLGMTALGALLYSFGFIVVSKFYMGSKYSKLVLSGLSFIACALIFFLI